VDVIWRLRNNLFFASKDVPTAVAVIQIKKAMQDFALANQILGFMRVIQSKL